MAIALLNQSYKILAGCEIVWKSANRENAGAGDRVCQSIPGLSCMVPPASSFAGTDSEVVRVIDFTEKPNGSAVDWLSENGYELRLDAESLDPRFSDKGLVLSTGGHTRRRARLSQAL